MNRIENAAMLQNIRPHPLTLNTGTYTHAHAHTHSEGVADAADRRPAAFRIGNARPA